MRTLFILLFTVLFCFLQAQTKSLRIISYNVENLFDCKDDSLKNDTEFLPDGAYHWTPYKFKQKLENISKVITTVGEWETPVLVGLIEVENQNTLVHLTKYASLKQKKYRYMHKESPDRRGIDVALLYQHTNFKPIKTVFYEVIFPQNARSKTRDILYTAGILPNGDTLHVFVNHFPSRYGGQKKSEPKRIYTAEFLKSKTDSIFLQSPYANIIIMGDFNDYPPDKSLALSLQAKMPSDSIQKTSLYNLAYPYHNKANIGSHKYKSNWGMLDHIIVSGNLLLETNTVYIKDKKMYICQEPFLLEDDTKYFGKKPFRTHIGKIYHGGYSDHLPVFIDIIIQ